MPYFQLFTIVLVVDCPSSFHSTSTLPPFRASSLPSWSSNHVETKWNLHRGFTHRTIYSRIRRKRSILPIPSERLERDHCGSLDLSILIIIITVSHTHTQRREKYVSPGISRECVRFNDTRRHRHSEHRSSSSSVSLVPVPVVSDPVVGSVGSRRGTSRGADVTVSTRRTREEGGERERERETENKKIERERERSHRNVRHTGRALNDCSSERSSRSWAWSVVTCGDETNRRMSSLSFPFLSVSFPFRVFPLWRTRVCAHRISIYTHNRTCTHVCVCTYVRTYVHTRNTKLYRPFALSYRSLLSDNCYFLSAIRCRSAFATSPRVQLPRTFRVFQETKRSWERVAACEYRLNGQTARV